jgi:hypothetical protein
MPGFLSPSFIFNLKSQLSLIQEKPFQEFLNSENAWWPYVATSCSWIPRSLRSTLDLASRSA